MSKQRKFDIIVENALHRFQRSEFLVGDLVKMVDNWEKDDWANHQSGGLLERLKQMIEVGHHIRVTSIKGLYNDGMRAIGNSQSPDHHYADIVEEIAPGRYTGVMTVPVHLLKRVDIGNNVTAPMPDDMVRNNDAHIGAEDVNVEETEDPMGAVKQTGVKDGDKSLRNKDEKMPGGNDWDDSKPGGRTMTDYLGYMGTH